ncbi:polymorphic toxin-type HINT domain-containing protein [Streptomyces varsoviensis]|uniref:polymorphic toxin-type HINT domain-containing protein n=1 Tax=Streptomyces varsoviensis TaxID=67373 RepID=UPI001FDF2E34|nr:polymorphic toxin-type HINT domain-containing protein [Streptomyces varsoviensis]
MPFTRLAGTTSPVSGSDAPVQRRLLAPFGEARGAKPSLWPGKRGFVGGRTDDNTGLTQLGAREYDPVTGRFVSVDPVIDFGIPQQMNPYAYANNAPATEADPDGEFFPVLIAIAARVALQVAIRAAAREAARRAAIAAAREAAKRAAIALAKRRAAAEAAKRAAAEALKKKAAQAAAAKARAEAARKAAAKAAAKVKQRVAAKAAPKRAAKYREAPKQRPKPHPKPQPRPKPNPKPKQAKPQGSQSIKQEIKKEVKEEVKEQAKEAAQPQSCEANSFVPGTTVLMADGSRKPIEQIKTDDKVLATDPETGESKPEPVVATIIGNGSKDLVKLTVSGDDHATTGALIATEGHPFWVPALKKWVDAGDLKPGQWLRTSAGTWVQVTAVQAWTQNATVHNLTVESVHTYYVGAGTAPVLVHNCGLSDRASEIHSAEPDEFVRKRVSTVAAIRADTPHGPINVVAGSGDGLTPAQMSAIRKGEIAADNIPGTHAEQNALLFINKMGWAPVAGGTSRNVCLAICAPLIRGTGGKMMGQVYRGSGVTTTRQRSFKW